MKTHKRLALCLLVALLVPLVSACLDGTSLDEFGYVLTIGVDAGEQKKFNVSFMLQKEGASQEAQTGAGSYIVSAEGDNLFDALTTAHVGIPYELNFTRTNFILFSDEIASSALMDEFLSISFNAIKIRQSAKMGVVRGECWEYLEGLSSADISNVAKRQYSHFQTSQYEGVIPITSFIVYREATESGRFDVALPVGKIDRSIAAEAGSETEKQQNSGASEQVEQDTTEGVKRVGGLRSYFLGCALFDGNRLAGILDDEDTEYILIALGQFKKGYVHLEDELGTVTFLLKEAKPPRVKMSLGDAPHAVMEVSLYAEIEMDTGGDAEKRWDSQLKSELEEFIVLELARVFEQCKMLNSDAMRFGKYACMQFASADEWRDYVWKEKYKNMTAEFSASVKLNDRMIASHME